MADYSSNITTDQQNNTIPGSTGKNIKKRSVLELLPEYFQTDTNKKFLNATLDQMIQSGNPIQESGYIGKKDGSIRASQDDVYLESKTSLNNRYQLDPTVVSQNISTLDYESAIPYDDIISKLKYLEANTTNLDKLFSDYNYSWRPPINVDMLINWNSYVWLPYSVPLIGLHGETASAINGKRTHTTTAQSIHNNRTLTLENGMRLAFSDDNKTYIVTGVGNKITLIEEQTLTATTEYSLGIATPILGVGTVDTTSNSVASPTITNQGSDYVYSPFLNVYDTTGGPTTHAILQGDITADGLINSTVTIINAGGGYATSGVELLVMGGQKARPPMINANLDIHYKHEYLCMEQCARDNNAWSRINNWYHIDTVRAVNTMLGLTPSFKIDGLITDEDYAQRPIIEWEKNLRLYNYGTHYRKPVDIIISEIMDPADSADGWHLTGTSTTPEVHDGYTIQHGDRVLFTNSTNATYQNRIWIGSTSQTGASGLTLETDGRGAVAGDPTHGDVITCLNGSTLQGKDYRFNGKTQVWEVCQEKIKANVPLKFELYDSTFAPLSEYNETNFVGNTVFEYLEDKTSATRTEDKSLGFPLTYATTNYLSSTNTSNLMFTNSLQETIYQHNRSTVPADILGFYYLQKWDKDTDIYNYDNGWKISYKQVRTPITITQDVTNAEDDFVIDLDTTNYEPERNYWVQATATGWEFYLKSAYGFEKLTGINPILYLARNKTYTFEVTNGTTAFQIQDLTAAAYNTGVTNNTSHDNTITFAVGETETNDILYYSAPNNTTGKIIIVDELLEPGWPEVFHNGIQLKRNIHYIINEKNIVIPYESAGTDETVSDGGIPVFSPLEQTQSTENLLTVGDVIDVKFYTTDTNATDEWAYDVPNQLKNNPSNDVLGNVQYAEMFNHFIDIIHKQPGLIGSAFGVNNYRSLDRANGFGGLINQQISPLLKLGLILGNENYDLLLASDYTADSYNVFKKKFIQKIEQLYASMVSGTKISALVDQALYDLNLGKSSSFPFANSDMVYYFNMVEKTYTVTSSTSVFALPKTITRINQYQNHVYVYKIDTNNVESYVSSSDYTLDIDSNTITFLAAVSSGKVIIKVSIDEGLSFIPPTLAKLGVTNATEPTSYIDNTGLRTVVVIEGHDGSKTVAFTSSITGSEQTLSHTLTDYRDKALLELENRIYSHIRPQFKANRNDLSMLPGKYRTTPYTKTDQNNFYDNYFNSYKIKRGITSLENTAYDANNAFTHNYSSTQAEGIGYWRGIYKYYFDTDRLHTHPWEMLGFIEKPSWWDTYYEWVNATKRENMINACKNGIISEPGQPIIQDVNVARSSAIFPVDASGNLIDPVTVALITAPTGLDAAKPFAFGDGSPVETVWQRSSLFPFVESNFMFSTNPAKYFEKYYDTLDAIKDGTDDVTINVTVGQPSAGIDRYYIDGVLQKTMVLEIGKKYTFDLTDASNDTHTFLLSDSPDGTHGSGSAYVTGWGGSATERTFTPASSAPEVLFYYCSAHPNEGGLIEIVNSNTARQYMSNKTKKRHNSNDLYIHNEIDTNSLSRRVLGLQQPIVDRLMFLGNDIYVDFARQLRQLSTKLSYKMQGFSKKSTISLLADSLQSEKSNNFVPNDDLTIKFHISSPYKEFIYSGVEIVKTTDGYTVYGYNNDKPYFNILKNIEQTISQITISNTNIKLFTEFTTDVEKIAYGTEYESINDVYNFLHAYGKYLESIGFDFTNPNIDGVYENWELSSNQFVLWAETDWGKNVSIKLSPAGNLIYFKNIHGHIKSNEYEYGSFFLDVDKSLFNSTNIDVDRQSEYITIKPKNPEKAIYCASLVVCDYEHLLLMNNKTIFDDIIYYPILGEAKHRFKIEYLKTPDWNGTLTAPGYLVHGDTIYENFDRTVENISDGYFNSEQTVLNSDIVNIARKNIGYEKKQFLRNMRLSPDVQFQFMKGVSHLKGTPEVFNRLTRSTFLLETSVDIKLEEEWIFRLGEFGPVSTQTTKEFTLNNDDIKANPQLINFGEIYPGQASDFDYDITISMLQGDSRWLEQPASNPPVNFTTRTKFDQSIDTIAEIETYEKDLPNAGYPKLEESTYQIFNLEDLPTLYDTYKTDDTSQLYKLLQTSSWKDTYTYAKHYYVRYKGNRYRSTRVIDAAAKSFNGIVNAKYTKTYDSGAAKEIVLEKCVFTIDNLTKLTTSLDPYKNGLNGVNARIGVYDFTYYPITSAIPASTVDTSITKGADSNGNYTYIFTFGDGVIPAENLPADDTVMYLSAFNYKTDAEALDSTVEDRWVEAGEEGLFNVWVADAGTSDWSTYDLQNDNFGVEQICKGYLTGDEALIKLTKSHNLVEGDYVMILGAENNPDLNGIHKVTGFPTGTDCVTCGLRNDKQFYIDEYVDNDEIYGKVFMFRKTRFEKLTELYNSISEVKWNWRQGNWAYADNYYKTQKIIIGTVDVSGYYNPFAEQTAFVSVTSYALLYSATNTDLKIYITKSKIPLLQGSGETKTWEVVGSQIEFYPTNIGTTWSASAEILIIFENQNQGYGSFTYNVDNAEWDEKRLQLPKSDTGQLANIIVYDYKQNKELARAETWDPYKGIVPGIAEKEIEIISGYDQALYSATTQDKETLTTTRHWSATEVGTTWWNLNTVRYLDYEQSDDLDYTFKHWGEQFPGSSIDVYEWSKSIVTPDEWFTLVNGEFELDGEVCSGEAYTKTLSGVTHYYWSEEDAINPHTGQTITYYYFWVKNKTTIPKSRSFRELSIKSITEYLNDPTGSGIFWASPGGASNIITGNVGNHLTKTSVFQINFTSEVENTHKEWITIREEDTETTIPDRFAERLHESILGFDQNKDTLNVAGIEEDQTYVYDNGSTQLPYTAKKFNFEWNSKLNYSKNDVVKVTTNVAKLYKTTQDINLIATNLKLAVDENTGTFEIRIGGRAKELTFSGAITIDPPPPESNAFGLPYENITAHVYPKILNGTIDEITIVRRGEGYSSVNKPKVWINPPIDQTSSSAQATVIPADVTVTDGEVTAITMHTDRKGAGYTNSYAIIDEGIVGTEEIVELKYFDEFASLKFNADVNLLINGNFELNNVSEWSTIVGSIAPTGIVIGLTITTPGLGYVDGTSETLGGSGSGLTVTIVTDSTTFSVTLALPAVFTRTEIVDATAIVKGLVYTIKTPGNTDWIGFGAANNSEGTIFIADENGDSESGTGVATTPESHEFTGNELLKLSSADTLPAPLEAGIDYRVSIINDNTFNLYPLLGTTFNVTIASPAVFTKIDHGFSGDEILQLSTTGTLPTGLIENTDYNVSVITTDVNATAIVNGISYTIKSPGNTDWTIFSAANSNVGTIFTADENGVPGSGTGVATITVDINATAIVSGISYTIKSPGNTDWIGFGAANNSEGTIFIADENGDSESGTGVATTTIDTDTFNLSVDVNATAIINETVYTIKSLGDTDWETLGVPSGTTPVIGTIFTADENGDEDSGTGVATTIINTSGTQSGVHQYILAISTLGSSQTGTHSYSEGKIQPPVTTDVNATAIVEGTVYTIKTPGNTDWIGFGAANNSEGTIFIADENGDSESGDGKATTTIVIAVGGGGYAIGDIVSVGEFQGTGEITITAVNSADIIYGGCSGIYTGAANATHYVGQKSLTSELGIAANITYVAKVLFKSDIGLDSVKLKYGHATTDVDFDAMTEIALTPTTSAIKTSVGATTVYGLSGEFIAHEDPYHALWLEITPGTGEAFTLHIDNLEFTNPATGDRIIVGRAAQNTTASAHLQYATFKELGNFPRQLWPELLDYEWITDRQLTVDSPNMVPSLRLNEVFRYGGQIRPFKQSWIISRLNAIRTLVQKANELLLTINLSDSQLNWRKRLGSPFVKGNSTFDTKDYWDYKDWFHPDYTISSSTVAQYTVTKRNDLYDVDEDVYSVVRVDSDDADGNWAFYQWVNDQWFKIGKQNGTIQLKNTLYNVADVDAGWDFSEWDIAGWDKNYTNELLNILIALREDIFVGPYKIYWKEMFFAILRYIYSEQTNLDWVAKTTFLQLNRKTPGELIPRTFDVGAEKDILDYLDLVKPYHSKIETIFDTRTFNEDVNAAADEAVDIRVQTNFVTTLTDTFTATLNQTTFTLAHSYTVGAVELNASRQNVEAYLNGVKLVETESKDYVAIDTSTVVLDTGAASGDVLETVAYTAPLPTTQTFTALANQTIFTLTKPYTVGGVEVYLNGIKLVEGSSADYVATDTSTVVLNTGAANGDALQTVAYATIPTTETFTATLNQATFTLTTPYIVGGLEVYLNGIKLVEGGSNDYVASNTSTVVLNTGAFASDVLQTVAYATIPTTETFTATLNQATFTLTTPYIVGGLEVYLNGIKLVENAWFSESNDYVAIDTSTVVLDTGAASGDVLQTITYDDAKTPTTETFTALATQTVFTLTNPYTVGAVEVYLNGIKLVEGGSNDYVATDTSTPYTVVLNTGAASGDVLQSVAYIITPITETFTATLNQAIFILTNTYIGSLLMVEVYLNGIKLVLGSSNDYTLTGKSNPYTVVLNTGAALNDVLQTVTYDEEPRAFRMFIDNTGTRIYERILNNNKTTTTEEVDAIETEINVSTVSAFAAPGEIVIGAERIRYTGINANTLTGCIRGLAGTAPATHASGASVISAGSTEALPVDPDPEAYNAFNDDTTTPLHLSTNTQAVLINVGKGTI